MKFVYWIAFVVVLVGCSSPPSLDTNVRKEFTDFNNQITMLYAERHESISPQLVNVGRHENSGDGDTLIVAFNKVEDDIKVLYDEENRAVPYPIKASDGVGIAMAKMHEDLSELQ